MSTMDNLKDFISRNRWPAGFAQSVMDSKDRVAFRFVVVDNSRSMLKQDGHRIVSDRHGTQRYYRLITFEL